MKKRWLGILLAGVLALPAAMQAQKIIQGAPTQACGGLLGYNTFILDSPENISFSCGGLGSVPIPNDVWVSTQTSNTAQATANVTTDQNLMSSTVGMPTAQWVMNAPGRTLQYFGAGTYSLGTSSTVTLKLKLCSVAGCGSGTVVTLASWTTASQSTTSVTLAYNLSASCVTVTLGSSGTAECHGTLQFDSGATLAAATSSFNDSNTAVISGLPLAGQWFLQSTLAFNTSNASNTSTLRLQTVDIWGPGVVN
jgi:hypothetical protein